VQGVGPGTVLGGRYALRRRLSHGPDLERWSAVDATLKREVALTVVGATHPNCAGVLDAARRAAGVEDARLVRILDVGTENDSSFIVEDARSGSESLATILLQGPLPAEEARRVAGETAKSLEAAGQRGLHHLRLTPHNVLVDPDGAIRVSGVAVAAAMDGPDEQEPNAGTALRRDALSLVAILYAALTSRWPLDEEVSGVEAAPRLIDGVVAPSEIVAGVPGDLDALCGMTLTEGNGPLTPRDFANRIAPWPRERVHRAGVDPTVVLRLPKSDDASDVVPVAVPVIAKGTEPTIAISTKDLPSQGPSHGPQEPARQTESAQQAGPTEPSPQPDGVGSAVIPAVGAKAAAAGAATTKAFGTAVASAGTAAGVVSGKLSSFARAAGDKRARTTSGRSNDQTKLPVGLTSKDDIGPPLPLLPASTALPPSRGQSKMVMLIMAAFVVGALFVGYRGLLGPGSAPSPNKPTARRTVTVSAPAVTVPASPAPQAATTAGGPIAILSATGFDPQGDQRENNSQAAKVYDGNPATTWTSELYATPQFGNLKKGVGLILDLGQPTSVHKVTIDLANGPVDVTVYAATGPNLQGATVIGTAGAATGRVELKASKVMPESQFIIVWFTALAPDGGQFGASISEIALN
jgi:eukaryotic-like serine/threonine-protein kinase